MFRASVLNYGRAVASDCEGFWTVFGPGFQELESGSTVFWSPGADDDYDFQNRKFTSAVIKFNERRFCWAEFDVVSTPVKGTRIQLFPYACPAALFIFALVVQYGQYKSFDFVGLEVPKRIQTGVPAEGAIEKIEVKWDHNRGLRGLVRSYRMNRFIAETDYHNYVRPT